MSRRFEHFIYTVNGVVVAAADGGGGGCSSSSSSDKHVFFLHSALMQSVL